MGGVVCVPGDALNRAATVRERNEMRFSALNKSGGPTMAGNAID